MGQETSCSLGCGLHAVWGIVFDHERLDQMQRNPHLEPTTENALNLFDRLHYNFEEAKLLGKQIEPIVGPVSISYSIKMRMQTFLCRQCFKRIDLERLPEEWGYEAYHNRNGYYHK